MKIGNSEILTTLVTATEKSRDSKNSEIKLFESNGENLGTVSNTAQGVSADVTINKNIEESSILGFSKQKIQINTLQGQSFEINLFIQGTADAEKIKILSEKIAKVMSNLPEKALVDMQKECRHIFILKNIPHNSQAKGLAIGPLNQIFLSSDLTFELSKEELSDTLIHETGHLIDQTNCKFTGKASNINKRAFTALKELLTSDLGFDPESHSLASISEFFADYYLNKIGSPSKNHRCVALFNKLDEYKKAFETLEEEAFNNKYGEQSEKIKLIAKKWEKLEGDFIYFLTNIDNGEVERIDENAQPMSLEQIEERNQQIKKES